MNIVTEHRIQSIFVAIESALLVYGLLATAALIKVASRVGIGVPQFAQLFRDFGFLLFLIPVGWALGTIYLQREDYPLADGITATTAWASLFIVALLVVKAVGAASPF